MEIPQKHSLWIVPKQTEGNDLQQFINTLANDFDAPNFVPHLTLVANIFTETDADRIQALDNATKLTQSIQPFDITFDGFGYTSEEFRCLFLKVLPSTEIDNAYDIATQFFPQVRDEHFRSMPHLSVLYGDYLSERKDAIITTYREHEIANLTFRVQSFDLFLTNSPIESWELESEILLR